MRLFSPHCPNGTKKSKERNKILVDMEQNQSAVHPAQAQRWKLNQMDSKKKASFQMQGNDFCDLGRPQSLELLPYSWSLNSPGTREWDALGLRELRKICEQIFLGSSYMVCPLWVNSTSPHPGHPFTANPSLVMPNKVLPLDLKFEQLSGLYKSRWESFLLLPFLYNASRAEDSIRLA